MTVLSSTNRFDFVGNGSQTAFPMTNCLVLASGDVQVYVDAVLKVITTDYTLSGIGSPSGTTVTFLVAPASSAKVLCLRVVVATQGIDYPPQGAFPETTHEEGLDRLTMIGQQFLEQVGRAAKFKTTSLLTNPELPDGVTNTVLAWETNTKLQNLTLAQLGAIIATGVTLPGYTLAGLPPAGTAGRLADVTDSSSTHTPGVYMDDGSSWRFIGLWNSAGPYAIGGATNANYQLQFLGSYTGGQDATAIGIFTALSPAATFSAFGAEIRPTIVEASSGQHPVLGSLWLRPATITAGAATVGTYATLYVTGPVPTPGTNNYSVFVEEGDVRLGGAGANTRVTIGGVDLQKRLTVIEGAGTSIPNPLGMALQNSTNTVGQTVGLSWVMGGTVAAAAITAVLEETTQQGTAIAFSTRTEAGGGTSAERMRLTKDGRLLLGHTTTTGSNINDMVILSAAAIRTRNNAGTSAFELIGGNASDEVVVAAGGQEIRWGRALIALGGGVAPTFGTIGGSGPATAAQNTWLRVIDSTGAAAWLPVWK